MAATAPPLGSLQRETTAPVRERNGLGVLAVTAVTPLAIAVHGYHPYAEDGGLYLAGIKRVLDPELYPFFTGFTTAHLRFSLFAPFVAHLVRATHLSLMVVMLLLHIATVWMTLFAAWQLALRCFPHTEMRLGALFLLAGLLTVPVAGTSLILMDPYVSARSISTGLGLLALVAAIDITRRIREREHVHWRSVLLCFFSLFLAALVHPLMAAYSLGCVLLLAFAVLIDSKFHAFVYGGSLLLAVAGALVLVRVSPDASPGYLQVARTRAYWFLSAWHWYESVGLIAPLLVLAAIVRLRGHLISDTVKSLAQMGLEAGVLAIVLSLVFARVDMPNYAIAKLQPLRIFHTIYFVTILVVGATLGQFALKRATWRWVAMFGALGTAMLFVQRDVFANSNHLELPWLAPANEWEQAFLWIKNNTPKNAAFALDADYITAPGEDAQNFRAIAERSALPDYSKDGGIASIAPDLTATWMEGERIQKGLGHSPDADRIAALRSSPVHWIVLSNQALTHLQCDYINSLAKVCRIPDMSESRISAGGSR